VAQPSPRPDPAARRLRIGIDASCWVNRRGFGRFTRCLVAELVARHPGHTYVLVIPEADLALSGTGAAGAVEALPPGAEVVPVALGESPVEAAGAGGSRRLADIARMARRTRRLRCDVFFFPASYSWFPVLGCPVVVTVHDAIAERLPRLTLPGRGDRVRWWLKQRASLARARAVVTVSEASRQALVDTLGVAPERIRVIREAPAPAFGPGPPEPGGGGAGAGPDAEDPYLLYVGGISPHKNLEVLVEAFTRAAPRHPRARLVLVGDPDGDAFLSSAGSVRRAIAASPVGDRIVLAGYVPDAELVGLYRGAVATVLPSLGEGFGLTAAESAACHTPVVASPDPALVELLGDAGLYADPGDPDAFARHFDELLGDRGRRDQAAAAAARRAERWSWGPAADTTLEVLASVARRG